MLLMTFQCLTAKADPTEASMTRPSLNAAQIQAIQDALKGKTGKKAAYGPNGGNLNSKNSEYKGPAPKAPHAHARSVSTTSSKSSSRIDKDGHWGEEGIYLEDHSDKKMPAGLPLDEQLNNTELTPLGIALLCRVP